VRLEAMPDSLTLIVGESADLQVAAFDAKGNRIPTASLRIAAPRRAVDASLWLERGVLRALEAGRHEIVVTAVEAVAGGQPAQVTIPVAIRLPPVDRVEIRSAAGRLYQGTTLRHYARGLHADGTEREAPEIRWSSSD